MTITEIFAKAGLNTLLGMGTVFVMLILISFVISLFRFLPDPEKKAAACAKEQEKPQTASRQERAAEETAIDDGQLIAVIAAAIAAASAGEQGGGLQNTAGLMPKESPYIVRSIKRIRK